MPNCKFINERLDKVYKKILSRNFEAKITFLRKHWALVAYFGKEFKILLDNILLSKRKTQCHLPKPFSERSHTALSKQDDGIACWK